MCALEIAVLLTCMNNPDLYLSGRSQERCKHCSRFSGIIAVMLPDKMALSAGTLWLIREGS